MSNAEILSEWLADLPLEERARQLNHISHQLTVCAREFYSVGAAADCQLTAIKKLLALSELHHKISSQVGGYLTGEETKVYPVDVFSEILYEIAVQHEILPYLNWAINSAKTRSSG